MSSGLWNMKSLHKNLDINVNISFKGQKLGATTEHSPRYRSIKDMMHLNTCTIHIFSMRLYSGFSLLISIENKKIYFIFLYMYAKRPNAVNVQVHVFLQNIRSEHCSEESLKQRKL
jgi:hypothetical protein